MDDDVFEVSVLESGYQSHAVAIARNGVDISIEKLSCELVNDLMDFRKIISESTFGKEDRPKKDQLIEFGNKLYNLIFQNRVDKIFSKLPNSHIRILIISNHPDFQSLPWEYLHQTGEILGPIANRSIVRIVPTIGFPPPVALNYDEKIKILFVYSEPIDQGPVDWEDIKVSIEVEFGSELPDRYELDIVNGANRKSLYEALNNKSYDIMHFVGHGEIIDGEGHLIFMDYRTHESDPMSASQLGVLLSGHGLRLVVMSACNTSQGDFTKEYAIIAKTLVKAGVHAVVANQFPIYPSTSAEFSSAFYAELLKDGDVDKATTKGRIALYSFISLESNEANLEYGIPTLYRNIGAKKIL